MKTLICCHGQVGLTQHTEPTLLGGVAGNIRRLYQLQAPVAASHTKGSCQAAHCISQAHGLFLCLYARRNRRPKHWICVDVVMETTPNFLFGDHPTCIATCVTHARVNCVCVALTAPPFDLASKHPLQHIRAAEC